MTGAGTDEPGDVAEPWARGGAMDFLPTEDGSARSAADSDSAAALPLDRSSLPATPGRPLTSRVEQDGEPDARPGTSRRWLFAGLVTAAGCVAALVGFAATSSDDAALDDAAARPIADGRSNDPDQPATTTDDAEPVTDTDTGTGTEPVTRETTGVLAPTPVEFVIEVGEALRRLDPTEVVAVSADGALYEISLPSGRVRVTELGVGIDQANVIANDGGTLIWPTQHDTALSISAAGRIDIVSEAPGEVVWSPGTPIVYLWPSNEGAADGVIGLDLSGQTTGALDAGFLDPNEPPPDFVDRSGAVLRLDTGGTYRTDASGTDLFTAGDVISTGSGHLLLRECDRSRSCTLVSVDDDGTRRSWGADLPLTLEAEPIGGLAPDGAAVVVDGTLADGPIGMGILDLGDGTLSLLQPTSDAATSGGWDSGSAGVFFSDPTALRYFNRIDGTTSVVSDSLPAMRLVATRRPIATPVCEVVAIVVPVFELMRTDGARSSVQPPRATELRRLLELAPPALADELAALVTFVNGFVSPEVAGSQNIENFPADAQAGLAALESFASTSCPLVQYDSPGD